MGDQQVGAELAGLLDDGERGVDGEVDAPHGLLGVAGDQADPVPRLGGGRRVEALDDLEHLARGSGRRRRSCGPGRDRTDDLRGVNAALYQLSYRPQSAGSRGGCTDRAHCGREPATRSRHASWPSSRRRPSRPARTPSRSRASSKAPRPPSRRKLLTILVEFNENANDDFTGVAWCRREFGSTDLRARATCRTARCTTTSRTRPTTRSPDNNSMWVPDFSPGALQQDALHRRGHHRAGAHGPHAVPTASRGIDISGYTMKNMYEEMSKGAYTVAGAATPWVKVPHSEAWYGASRCFQNDERRLGGRRRSRPCRATRTTRSAPGQLPIDAVDALAAGAARLPVGRLRHRGPGRPRRRRQLLRAGRRHRPRRARARR